MSDGTDGRHPMLAHLEPLVGTWESAATHPELPGIMVPGQATIEWLAGGHFLIWRQHHDHPDFPDGIAMIGFDNAPEPGEVGTSDEPCAFHSFDSRGVYRVYYIEAEPGGWRLWRDWPGFSQRTIGTFSNDGNTITEQGELSEDDGAWKPDLQVTYKRIR